MLLPPGDDYLSSVGLGGSQGPGGVYVEIPVQVTMPARHCTIRGLFASPRLRWPHSVQQSLVIGVLQLKLCDPIDLFWDFSFHYRTIVEVGLRGLEWMGGIDGTQVNH